MGSFFLYLIVPLVFGFLAQHWVKASFKKFSLVPNSQGLTGAQVARQILDRHGLTNVEVLAAPGSLSDHYDPRTRKVALSEDVYDKRSIAAMSVAAHEVGHALQHANSYLPLNLRTRLFPAAAFASQTWIILLFAGVFLHLFGLIWLALVIYSAAVLFQIVTLPVEFNASHRAGEQLKELGLISPDEAGAVRKVLTAAAMTYVAAAIASIAMFVYYWQLANSR